MKERVASSKNHLLFGVPVVLALVIMSAVFWWFYKNTKPAPVQTTPIVSQDTLIETPIETPEPEEKPMDFDEAALQKAVDSWVKSLPAKSSAGVVLTDGSGGVLASYKSDKVFPSASIYKLFVAYEAYQRIDSGKVKPDKQYVNGHTLAECLDLMIRISDNPCAEKLLEEFGEGALTAKMKSYGLDSTDLVAIRTSAKDAAAMMLRIVTGEGLSDASQEAYLTSMKKQIYREGLPTGFSSDVTTYDKVGFNELHVYHDVAFVELEDGRRLIVSVMTQNVDTAKIAKLASAIEAAAAKPE